MPSGVVISIIRHIMVLYIDFYVIGAEMVNQETDFYENLRSVFTRWSNSEEGKSYKWKQHLLFSPDLFLLLCKLSINKDIPAEERAKIAGAIAYFVAPIDLIPEALVGPAGYRDDIALAAYVLDSIEQKTNPEILRKYWKGNEDVLGVIRLILDSAEEMVGSDLWVKLKKVVD